MKKWIILGALMGIAFLATAQQPTWKELNDFHEVMSKTYHPAENNNLAPLKENIGLMVQRAEALRKAPMPAGFDKREVRRYTKKLLKQVKEIQEEIAEGESDAELKEELTEAHTIFHHLAEKCSPEEHKP